MPTDLLSALGPASAADRLSIVMTRQRTSPFPPRTDPETTIARQFTLPTARIFTLSGSASLSALLPDDEIDRLVGRTPGAGSYVDSYSSGRLPGDLQATASATLDGDSSTAWQPGLGTAADIGATLTYNLSTLTTLSGLTLQVIADGRHSVPTAMTIATGGVTEKITLPPIADSTVAGAVTTVPVQFPALGIRPEMAANYYSAGPLTLPLGIAEIGMPGVQAPPTPSQLPGTCMDNLLTIDGQPIDVAIVGSTQGALDNSEVQIEPCGFDADGIILAAGTHVVQTAVAHTPSTGWNIDQLVLDSAAGGGPGPAPTPTPTANGTPDIPATQAGPAPRVTVTSEHIDTEAATVTGATTPFELVLGQSVNAGWQAVATPGPGAPAGAHAVDLGPSQLVDSFANGWAVTPADLHSLGSSSFLVALTWTPQSQVWLALVLSGLTLLLCLLLAFLPARWRTAIGARVWRHRPRAAGTPAMGDDGPTLSLQLRRDEAGVAVSRPTAVLLGLATGLAASAVTSLAVGLAVAALVVAGLIWRPVRWIAAVGAVVFMATGCLNVIFGQAVHHYLPGSNWAGSFVGAGQLIWVGVVLLLADAVIVSAGGRTPRPAPPASAGPSPPR
jgi:hypothetical protein